MKKISIIVPIYNVSEYIDRMMENLLYQEYANTEIILVDDGSTDDSLDKCNKYKNLDKRVKVIHQNNSGVSVARNVGIKKSTGDFIAFVDSDDVISKSMLNVLYNNLVETESDISVCNYVVFKDSMPIFDNDNNITIYSKMDALKDIITDSKLSSFLWNKLFKRELFDNIKFPEGKIFEDLYVMPKLIEKANRVCYTNMKLYGYYVRSNSYVNTYSPEKNNNFLAFSNECYEYLLKYPSLKENCEDYKLFYIYSAFLKASKSHSLDIIKSDNMNDEYKYFKNNFKLSKTLSLKRRILYCILYINKNLFYRLITIIK